MDRVTPLSRRLLSAALAASLVVVSPGFSAYQAFAAQSASGPRAPGAAPVLPSVAAAPVPAPSLGAASLPAGLPSLPASAELPSATVPAALSAAPASAASAPLAREAAAPAREAGAAGFAPSPA